MKTLILACLAFGLSLSAPVQGATSLDLKWFTWAGGGRTSSNAFGLACGTIGQPGTGAMTADRFTLVGGFWAVDGVAAVQAPRLTVCRTATNTVVVSWASADTSWKLQAAENLSADPAAWKEIAPPYLTDLTCLYYIEPVPTGQRYYRLHKP